MEEYRLQMNHISKTFPGTKALSDVSLAVKKGEVRALVGENGAGKSTLMNVLGGVLQKDEGSGDILIDGTVVKIMNPIDAIKYGVGFVHQELSIFSHLTVAENVFADRQPLTALKTIDKRKMNADAAALLSSFDLDISPKTEAKKLSVGNKQMVEIIRAVSLNAKIIIFDEPTSSLSEKEVEMLFRIIRKLKETGVSVLYISHKLNEVFSICDTVSVLRDGQMVAEFETRNTTQQQLINSMIGREISAYYLEKSENIGEELFYFDNFRLKKDDEPISFSVKKNEILGLYGLVGSGRTELVRAICGIDPCFSGEISILGKKVKIKNYQDALKNGIAYLTEDRKELGIFPTLSVSKNIFVSSMCKEGGFFLDNKNANGRAHESTIRNNIKTSSVIELIRNLSGGNQQKVILARCLEADPKLVILDEPTKGIDVNAKAEIHKKVRALANEGIGVIVISSEMMEIIGLSDEIIVMHEGRKTGILSGEQLTEKTIIQYATEVFE